MATALTERMSAAELRDLNFEFNPSAPEFVPILGSPLMLPTAKLHGHTGLADDPLSLGCDQLNESGGVSTRSGTSAPDELDEVPPGRTPSSSPILSASRQPRRLNGHPPTGRQCVAAPPSPALTTISTSSSNGRQRTNLRRRAASSEEVATLVIKNLAVDFQKEDVMKYLESIGAAATEVELHIDPASGTFRGTVFARYASPQEAHEALEKLGASPELGGRKVRVEIQKSKSLFGRKNLGNELPQELSTVQKDIEEFINSPDLEVCLSASFDSLQRKYAHSLAERHSLVHATRQNEKGETYVFLSKSRATQPLGIRKKALSEDFQSGSQTGQASSVRMRPMVSEDSFQARSSSCYLGPQSPPGFPFSGFGTPLPDYCRSPFLGATEFGEDAASWSLPAPAVALPPGIETTDFTASGLTNTAWPTAFLHSLAALNSPMPPPGLDLVDVNQPSISLQALVEQLVPFQEGDFKEYQLSSEFAMTIEEEVQAM
jgi:RNA recognition motif-containing protein